MDDVTAALEALPRIERHAFTVACAHLRDEDVASGRPGRAAVWAALCDVAAEVSLRERSAFAEAEDDYWRAENDDV